MWKYITSVLLILLNVRYSKFKLKRRVFLCILYIQIKNIKSCTLWRPQPQHKGLQNSVYLCIPIFVLANIILCSNKALFTWYDKTLQVCCAVLSVKLCACVGLEYDGRASGPVDNRHVLNVLCTSRSSVKTSNHCFLSVCQRDSDVELIIMCLNLHN